MKCKTSRLMIAGLVLTVSVACAADRITVGVGSSDNESAKMAGEEAAKKAKDALGASEVKLVIVFAARKQLTADLVAGVAGSFDKSLIFGCEGYSPVTTTGNFADQGHTINKGVAVMVIGGDVKVTAVSAEVSKAAEKMQGFVDCGKRIGDGLKPALDAASKGKVILTFGNQHVGSNQPFVDGLTGVIGTVVPVVGAAAGGDGAKEIVKGEVTNAVNIAVLLSGDFKVGVGLAGGAGDLVAKTEESLSNALKAAGGNLVAVLIFDCGGRRGDLVKQQKIVAEYEVMKKLAGKVPFFGFYGGGEIGTQSAGAAPKGVGFSTASAVISVE